MPPCWKTCSQTKSAPILGKQFEPAAADLNQLATFVSQKFRFIATGS